MNLTECLCESEFTDGTCEDLTGRCYCKPNYTGENCDACAEGYEHFPVCYRKSMCSKICICTYQLSTYFLHLNKKNYIVCNNVLCLLLLEIYISGEARPAGEIISKTLCFTSIWFKSLQLNSTWFDPFYFNSVLLTIRFKCLVLPRLWMQCCRYWGELL